MTITQLQNNIVLRLANSGWCRYWCVWGNDPVRLAVQFIQQQDNGRFEPVRIKDLEQRGFELHAGLSPAKPLWIYTIPRVNDDGTPYLSHIQ